MLCQITLSLDGVRSHSEIEATDSIAALLQALQTVPEGVRVKAIVQVIKPTSQ